MKSRLSALLAAMLCGGIASAATLESSPARTLGPDQGLHYNPDGVAIEGGYLVAWQQGQDHVGTPGGRLLLRRLDSEGRPLGEVVAPCDPARGQEHPRMARNGQALLLVWQDFRNGRDWDLFATRLDADGRADPPCGLAIAEGPENAALPVVAAAPGGGFLVVWQQTDSRGFYRLHAALVTATGEIRRLGNIRNRAADAADWRGYTPGWGVGRMPLHAGHEDDDILTGGLPELVEAADGWLLTWQDESNWGPGGQAGITRRLARLSLEGERLVATAVAAAPSNGLGRQEARLNRHGDRILLTGRSIINRGVSYVAGGLLPADGLAFLPNPNPEPRKFGAGWDAGQVISLFRPALGMEGPVAATGLGDGFLVAAVGDSRAGGPHARRILGNLLAADGRRLLADDAWPVLHEGAEPPSHPLLIGAGERALLVFEQRSGGDRLIQARLIRRTGP